MYELENTVNAAILKLPEFCAGETSENASGKESAMSVQVTYTGDGECMAIDRRSGRRVASDCSMTKGQEFGPESLVAAGLGSCMLISMSSYAERHGLDVSGSRIEVKAALGGKPEMRITGLEVTVKVPKSFTEQEQARLEKAAEACPIKHSFRPDTEISTRYEFGESAIAAA